MGLPSVADTVTDRSTGAKISVSEPPLPGLVGIKRLADYTDTSEAFWRRLILERRIRFYKVARSVRIDWSDAMAFIQTVDPR